MFLFKKIETPLPSLHISQLLKYTRFFCCLTLCVIIYHIQNIRKVEAQEDVHFFFFNFAARVQFPFKQLNSGLMNSNYGRLQVTAERFILD